MAEPYLAEIKMFSFEFAPKGWALCNGQLLPINQNLALFSLLGTTFGGNGQTTFALPDLRTRTPVHAGNGHTLGESGGEAAHTLVTGELPTHTHALNATNGVASTGSPGSNVLATPGGNVYGSMAPTIAMGSNAVTAAGGSQPHNNMQPFLTINFCIALQGIFPSPN